jgi:3-keto-5-aminohexanoate cleavage enzyme
MRKVIISLAPVRAGTPVDSQKLADDVAKSVRSGAAMCHLHCRRPDGSLTSDITYLKECFDAILKKADVIVQASTGGVSNLNIQERCAPLEYEKVESASLNGGSTNLGESVYSNSFDDIRYSAKAVYDRHILPETEVFEIGMLHNMELVQREQPFAEPVLYNLVFGHPGIMQATPETLAAFCSFVPKTALWGVTHYGRDNWTFLAAAIASGATIVRVGFEDSDWLSETETARFNWQVVERLVQLIRAMGLEPATPQEAREILRLSKR